MVSEPIVQNLVTCIRIRFTVQGIKVAVKVVPMRKVRNVKHTPCVNFTAGWTLHNKTKNNQNLCRFCMRGDQRLNVLRKITSLSLEVKEIEGPVSSFVNFHVLG